MMRRPHYALTLAAIAAGSLLLTHSLAFQRRSQSPGATRKPTPAHLSPGGLFTPFPHDHTSGAKIKQLGPSGDGRAKPEPIPLNGTTQANSHLIIQHDPIELVAGKPAQIQILLSRTSSTDTRIELSATSPSLNLPRSIVIPAGHALAAIRLIPSASNAEAVTLTATAADPTAPGGKTVSQAILTIQAQPNKREDRK